LECLPIFFFHYTVFCPVCIKHHSCTWLIINFSLIPHIYISLHNVLLLIWSIPYLLLLLWIYGMLNKILYYVWTVFLSTSASVTAKLESCLQTLLSAKCKWIKKQSWKLILLHVCMGWYIQNSIRVFNTGLTSAALSVLCLPLI
jgi:hypothetical protein